MKPTELSIRDISVFSENTVRQLDMDTIRLTFTYKDMLFVTPFQNSAYSLLTTYSLSDFLLCCNPCRCCYAK